MRRLVPGLLLTVAVLGGGCSRAESENRAAPLADVNAAAAAAQGDIASYADQVRPAAPPRQAATPTATPAPVADADAVGEAEDAARAAAVAQRYFAAIAARDYATAYALWDDGANPEDRRAFAARLSQYAAYRATVGPPGRVDAGAGQRYVTIPVRITATPRGQPATTTEGALVLHRTGAIDGATAAQRSWRIRELHLDGGGSDTAATDPTPALPAVVRATYRCDATTRLSVRFDNRADTAIVTRPGRDPVTLAGQRPASGIWYRGGGYELRGKGTRADFTAPGAPPVACTARD